jgi:hypothetical protein
MMTYSYESDELKKLILSKRQYLSKLQGFAYKQLQKEILFLENNVLPIILRDTNIEHSEFSKYCIRAYETAVQFHCNGLLIYQHLMDDYTEQPIIGIANESDKPKGTGAMTIYIDNMDGNGVSMKPINLLLNDLL